MIPTKPLNGWQRLQVNWGETIQQFAYRATGDAAEWVDIVAINNLVAPYTAEPDLAGPRVARYGDSLLIKGVRQELAPVAGDVNALFGKDVALNKGMLGSDRGDFSVVAGRENLKGALSRRIIVHDGELMFHPEYGCEVHKMRGEKSAPIAALLGAAYVRQAIVQDPRVATIVECKAALDGDTMRADATVEAVSGHLAEIKAEV